LSIAGQGVLYHKARMMASRRLVATLGVTAAAMATFYLGQQEGDKYVPYRDVGGVWTVCRGVTGPSVIPGRTYTKEECADMDDIAADVHAQAVVKCVTSQMDDKRKAGLTLFAYNVGNNAFCRSQLVKDLNNNKPDACAHITNDYYKAGGLDCRIRSNNCYGLITRRQLERRLCEGK
jgi:lysozyme